MSKDDDGGGSGDGPAGATRHAFVASLDLSTGVNDPDFGRIARLAARELEAPVALISLVDGAKLRFYARFGTDLTDAPIDSSPCGVAAKEPVGTALIVLNAAVDARFAESNLVGGPLHLRFYVGVPVVVHGQKVGTLCVISPEPRASGPSPEAIGRLVDLAALAASLLELKDEARARSRMAADLMREEWRHALTLEAGKVGSWIWDVRGGEVVCNDLFRQMFGLGSGPLKLDDLTGRIDSADLERVGAALKATFEEGADYAVEFRVGRTGRWLIGRGRVYQRDGTGKPLVMMGVNIDVTEERQSAERTRALLRELNHRVKNTLAMIQALARQTLRQKPDPAAFMEAFSGRLRTLSDAHELLSARDWTGLGLVELVHAQVDHQVRFSPEQLEVGSEDVDLPPDQALGLGIVLHELASNASRYGALSTASGSVTICWTVENASPRPLLRLSWIESGGPAVSRPSAEGFGVRLIERSLDKIIGSTVALRFPKSGVEADLVVPLD